MGHERFEDWRLPVRSADNRAGTPQDLPAAQIRRLKRRDVDDEQFILKVTEDPAYPLEIYAQRSDAGGSRNVQRSQGLFADGAVLGETVAPLEFPDGEFEFGIV